MNPLPHIESITLIHAGTGSETVVVHFKPGAPLDALVAQIPREWTDEQQEAQ